MSTETPAKARLKARYASEIVPALREEFHHSNVNEVPRLTKIVVNMGVGEAARDSKLIDGAIRDLAAITGQKPQVTARRHADRSARHAARRPDVGVPGPAAVRRAAAHP
jgi:large subunit ribosomal protein L5